LFNIRITGKFPDGTERKVVWERPSIVSTLDDAIEIAQIMMGILTKLDGFTEIEAGISLAGSCEPEEIVKYNPLYVRNIPLFPELEKDPFFPNSIIH